MTSGQLAAELEVARRTILRDVDALTEAGLPIIVLQGAQGGIELGFNYRTRLTGLAADEAEAMALVLTWPISELTALGLGEAAARASAKLLESFPETVRTRMMEARARFRVEALPVSPADPRLQVLAEAVRNLREVLIAPDGSPPRRLRPMALTLRGEGWFVIDRDGDAVAVAACGDISVSVSPPRMD